MAGKRRNENAPFWRQMAESERRIIQHALEGATSIRRAAVALGISEAFLIGRVKKLGLKCPRKERAAKEKTPRQVQPVRRSTDNVILLNPVNEK